MQLINIIIIVVVSKLKLFEGIGYMGGLGGRKMLGAKSW